MSEIVNDNQACCSIPPVTVNYDKKGAFEQICGLKAYFVGPKSAKKAVIYVYDAFGMTAQAFQGADILAAAGDTLVIMPDFFDGAGIDPALFTPSKLLFKPLALLGTFAFIGKLMAYLLGNAVLSKESKAKGIQAFFAGTANPDAATGKVGEIVGELKARGVGKVGGVGFCWGGKVCMQSRDLDAIALCHPSLLGAKDAEQVTVPVALLPSKDESKPTMQALKETLEKKDFASKNVYKTFDESPHGYAAARANLAVEKDKKDFEEVWQILVSFFKRTLE